MEKLKEQLIEVETSIGRVNDSLSEMRAGRRLPFYVPSSASQTYQYLPMKADREIRLLYLEPGSGKSRLSCFLRIIPLSKTPIYEALSYTWGKPEFPASIKCSPSGQLCITENLSVALYYLRLKDRIRVLWVDAICINQQDLVERSQQVSLMRDVYKGADHVIVWLGKDNGNAKKAFEGLRDLAVIHPTSDYKIEASTSRGRADALDNLLTRGWFLRIWVIQELVCARKATIMCGNQSMECERFLDFARTIVEEGSFRFSLSVAVMVPLNNLNQIGVEKKQRCLGKQSSLVDLLFTFRGCLASDLRDKIFALVGIADGQTIAACTPDYSKDVSEVYRNLASHLIINERNPDILAFCVAPTEGQSLFLPSWVPDWSQPQRYDPSPYIRPDAYKASAGTSFKGRIDFNTLSLDGVLLNKIVILGRATNPGLDKYATREMYRKEYIEQGEESFQIFKGSRNYAQSDLTAYVRTLVADVSPEHRPERQQLLTLCAAHRLSISIDAPNSEFAFSWDEFSTTRDGSFGQPVEWQDMQDLWHARASAALCRRFCLFDDGHVGWVPDSAKIGDRIAIFLGSTVPILLRPRGNDYIILGEAYVDEMMDGQAFEGPEVQIETIKLV